MTKQLPKFFLLAVAILFAGSSFAHDVEVDGIYYNLDATNRTASVTYEGSGSYYDSSDLYTGAVVIPASITANGVAYTVTSIGNQAFRDCSDLTAISIPKSVTSIGNGVFVNCGGLTAINVSPDNSAYCSADGILYNKDKTILCSCPGGKTAHVAIPKGVTSIGSSAFSWCCSLTSVSIPESVTDIGDEAFSWCSSLTSVNLPEGLTSIGSSAFEGCSKLVSIDIPEGVTSIGVQAFGGCGKLVSINIPEGVTSIGPQVFNGCSSLTSVSIPSSVTSIGMQAFYGCRSLTSVSIPSSVTSIGMLAFSDCSSLTTIYCYNPLSLSTDYDCFDSTHFRNATLFVPIELWFDFRENSRFMYICGFDDERFYNLFIDGISYTLETPTQTAHVLTIEDRSVQGDMVIPASVTYNGVTYHVRSIAERAFQNCSKLTSITIPASVTDFGHAVFNGCSGLTSVNLLEGVTTIGSNTFYNCSSLTVISIPSSVTYIGEAAFYGCKSLASVTIPEGVTTISDRMFYNCSSLRTIAIREGVTSIGEAVFSGCNKLTTIYSFNPVPPTGGYLHFQQHQLRECYIVCAPGCSGCI